MRDRDDLAGAVAKRTCRPRTEAKRMLEALLAEIRERLAKDGTVTISSFGRFAIVEHADRVGQNFATGERISVPGKQVVKFSAAPTVLTGQRSPWAWDQDMQSSD